jgi:hypothetical protein
VCGVCVASVSVRDGVITKGSTAWLRGWLGISGDSPFYLSQCWTAAEGSCRLALRP